MTEIVLRDGSMWEPSEEDMQVWHTAYPELNIHEQLRKMAAWCYCNTDRRKTRRGIKRFVNNWLSNQRPEVCSPASRKTRDVPMVEELTDRSWSQPKTRKTRDISMTEWFGRDWGLKS